VSPSTIRRKIHCGELDALRVGARGGLRVQPEALTKLLIKYQPNGDD
jgi:hypothetical protein